MIHKIWVYISYLLRLYLSCAILKCNIDVSHCNCNTTNELTITSILLSLHNVENKWDYVLYFLIGLFSDLDQGNVILCVWYKLICEKCIPMMCTLL